MDGRYGEAEAEGLSHYIDTATSFLPGPPTEVIDEYLDLFERAWDELAPGVISDGLTRPRSRALCDQVAEVSCLHLYYPRTIRGAPASVSPPRSSGS